MTIHVVHLEDDRPLCEILKAAFQATDPRATIRQFNNSDLALNYIKENLEDIDLFVLDIRVSGTMTGVEVAQRIRDMKYTGAVVLTSAYVKPDPILLRGLNCQWFPKPWHILETAPKLLQLARQHNK